jgi:hypothetical protein
MKFHMLKLFLMEKVIPDEDFGGFSSPYISVVQKIMQSFTGF